MPMGSEKSNDADRDNRHKRAKSDHDKASTAMMHQMVGLFAPESKIGV